MVATFQVDRVDQMQTATVIRVSGLEIQFASRLCRYQKLNRELPILEDGVGLFGAVTYSRYWLCLSRHSSLDRLNCLLPRSLADQNTYDSHVGLQRNRKHRNSEIRDGLPLRTTHCDSFGRCLGPSAWYLPLRCTQVLWNPGDLRPVGFSGDASPHSVLYRNHAR